MAFQVEAIDSSAAFRVGMAPPTKDWFERIEPSLQMSPETLLCLTGAYRWMRLFRQTVADSDALDMPATATAIGAGLDEASQEIGGSIAGTIGLRTAEPLQIGLSPWRQLAYRRLSFGHEVGHIFLGSLTGLPTPPETSAAEERFCEAFGIEMAVPSNLLPDERPCTSDIILDQARRFMVPPDAIILQYMKLGILPPKVLLDSGVDSSAGGAEDLVQRALICHDCYYDRACEEIPPVEELLVVDATSQQTWSSINNCSQFRWSFSGPAFEALNKHYGRC